MKWIGQHIWDFISRFRSDVYLEATETGTIASGGNLGLDSNNKVVKATGVSSSTLASTVTVTDSTTNTYFPIVFHNESNGLLDDTGAFKYNPSLADLALVASGNGSFSLYETADTANDIHVNFYNTKGGAAGDDNDNLGTFSFYGKNDAGSPQTIQYGSFTTLIADASDSDEAGKIAITVATEGVERQGLTVTGDGASSKVDVGLGYGATSTTTIAGTLTMGSTAFVNNSGVVQVATQGTIDHDSLANFVAQEHIDWAGASAGIIHSSNIPTLNQDTTGTAATVTGAAQTNITSLGTLTNLDVDNININGDTITASADLSIVATGNDIAVDTDNFVIESATSNKPVFELKNTTVDNTAPTLKFTNTNGGTDGDIGDYAGTIEFTGNDDGTPSEQIYGQIVVRQHVAVSNEESGDLTIKVAAHDGDLNLAFRALGGSEDSEVDVTIANGTSSLTTVAGDLKVNGTPLVGWHGSSTRIKILPRDFVVNDGGRPVMIEDDSIGSNELFLFSVGNSDAFAYVPIPAGYKATHVRIYGNTSGENFYVYEGNIDSKTIVDIATGATAIGSEKTLGTELTSDTTNYLIIRVTSGGTTEEIHGGYVTIAQV